MSSSMKYAAVLMAALMPTAGCLGLFGDDDETDETESTSLSKNLGNATREQLIQQAAGQFKNFTIEGQAVLDTVVTWANGTLGAGQAVAGYEDRNDRSGNDYGTEVFGIQDLTSQVPPGQPVEIRAKLWYLPGPGSSGDLDIYANVPGLMTEFAGDDCDEFSWKVCVQEMTINTVGVSGMPMEIGVEASNGRAAESLDYFLQVQLEFAQNVITPYLPYAFNVPENATGIVVSSVKAGGSEHIRAELLLIGPNDELVEFTTYDDISIPTESKFIPVPGPGEYVLYAPELEGGFLEVSADVPVPKDQRMARALERVEQSVVDGSGPAPGMIARCVPNVSSGSGCAATTPYNEGGSATFAVEGTFPLEVLGFIGDGGSSNLMAEINITSSQGWVFGMQKFVQHEDDRGTLGLSRDELNTHVNYANLATGSYTISFVIDGNADVGHTVVTYDRGGA